MTLKDQIREDMKDAMRTKEVVRLGVIRMLISDIKKLEIDKQITLDDNGVMDVINKMIKQRRDSFQQFTAASRTELATKEQQEIDVLQNYLPAQLSAVEIEEHVKAAIASTGATGAQDMGKVMAVLKLALAGKADMSIVSAAVKKLL